MKQPDTNVSERSASVEQKRKQAVYLIGRNAFTDVDKVIREAKELLAYHHGIKEGVQIQRHLDNSIYKITKISNTPSKYCGFWLYGLKKRCDGTWGTHTHSICEADSVTVMRKP